MLPELAQGAGGAQREGVLHAQLPGLARRRKRAPAQLARLEAMAQQDAAGAGRRDLDAAGGQGLGDARLPVGGVGQGVSDDRALGGRRHPVGQQGALARDGRERGLAAVGVLAPQAVVGVSGDAHDLAGAGNVAQHAGKLQQLYPGAHGIVGRRCGAGGAGRRQRWDDGLLQRQLPTASCQRVPKLRLTR